MSAQTMLRALCCSVVTAAATVAAVTTLQHRARSVDWADIGAPRRVVAGPAAFLLPSRQRVVGCRSTGVPSRLGSG